MAYDFHFLGRAKLYTDYDYIDADNVLKVIADVMPKHLQNAADETFLLNYEKGVQPLKQKKDIRPEIDITFVDNLANEIVEFVTSYEWGNPISYIQRGDKDLKGNAPKVDNDAIYALNEMLDAEFAFAKDQELARFITICGVGVQMVDIKREDDGKSPFDIVTLDPRNAFVVYRNSTLQEPILGVTFCVLENGTTVATAFTKDTRFEIRNFMRIENGKERPVWEFGQRSGEPNALGKIPIVEFERQPDRTGILERQLSALDGLNQLVSNVCNAFTQEVQTLYWANDIEFPQDENGNTISPKSGQWILSNTGADKNPKVQALSVQTQYSGILQNIRYQRDVIKEKCSVPIQTEPGGGSTGTAMSMSSGWQNAETVAAKRELLTRRSKMMLVDLIVRACHASPYVRQDDPILRLSATDVKPSITRNKQYDMATKANTFATWISHGIHPRHALQQVEAFPDTNLVYEDSMPYMDKYLTNLFAKNQSGSTSGDVEDLEGRHQADTGDQLDNSPLLGGAPTRNASGNGIVTD